MLVDDAHIWVEPSGVVHLLQFVAQPLFHILSYLVRTYTTGAFNVTRILSLNSLHTSDRSDRWNSIELLRGPFQATTTEEWNYPIVRSI